MIAATVTWGDIIAAEQAKAARLLAICRAPGMASDAEVHEARVLCDSYWRMPMVVMMASRMERAAWLHMVREEWSTTDNVGKHRRELRWLLGTSGPLIEMMDEDERAARDALPDVITCYRGCGPSNMLGCSWTTDRSVAERFPFTNRSTQAHPLLITGRVKKTNVLAVKLCRNEAEVISFSVRRVKVEALEMST